MEKIKSVKYKDLVKELSGKDINDIKDILLNKYEIFKDVDNIDFLAAIDDTVNQISNVSNNLPSIYLFLRREKMFFNAIELLTNIGSIPKDISIEDFDFNLEYAFKSTNLKFKIFYEMVEDGIEMRRQLVLDELAEVFNTKIPNVKELEKIKNELDNMFKDESPERLKIIKDILSFNDPTMVGIKNTMTQIETNILQDKLIEESKKQ